MEKAKEIIKIEKSSSKLKERNRKQKSGKIE